MLTTPNGNGSNFFSSGLRQKIDQLMDILWAGGVNNPMDSIEQISYLLFLRLLTEKDEQLAALDNRYKREFSGRWARFAWGNFVTLTGDELFNSVRDAIESLHELPGLTETGKLLFNRATLKIYDRPTLRAVVQGIHNLDLAAHGGHDFKGDMYEYLLSKLSMSGTNGQFRTPRHIIDMIVTLVRPQAKNRICDPACGTAGFLISAFKHILDDNRGEGRKGFPGGKLTPAQWTFLQEQAFTGFDNDANMVKIAILNLYLHQLEKAQISLMNPLTTGFGGAYPGRLYDVILANPPFSGKIQDESILSDLNYKLNTRATELLFLKWFIDHLAPGGRAGVIVPNGLLYGPTGAARAVRQLLMTECDLQAVITMPNGVFKPYAGVATAALIFQKGTATKSVWFYDLAADGFTLDDRRAPISNNDIPDVLLKWPMREEGPNSYRVSIDRIKAHSWSLAAGRYRPQKIDLNASGAGRKKDSLFVQLGDLLEISGRDTVGNEQSVPVMSITMENGLIDQGEKFKKRIASADISKYKKVYKNELVVGFPIDEGVLGFQTKYPYAAVSPAYAVWRLKRDDIGIEFLEIVLRSLRMREIYRSKMQGGVDRRRSIPRDVFLEIEIPNPASEIQSEIVLRHRQIIAARQEIKKLESEIEEAVGRLLPD